MKMKGMLLASLTLLSGAVMLTACSANQRKASDSKTLYLMQTGDILSLDNSNQSNLTQWNVLEQSMEGMYRAGKNGKLIPAMATSIVKPTNSGRTYTYHLRKNARWSNGDPVTAQDFVTSWRRSTAPTSKSGYNYIFTGIKNAEQISAGKMPPSSLGVRALDRHTLRVDLEYAMPYFNKMMVMPAFFPQNTGYVKKFGDKYGTNSARVACNGAFKVKGWTGTNDKWSLTPNTHYYDRKNIRMDKMVMQIVKDSNTAHQLFQENKLDDAQITGTTAQGLQKNKNLMHLTRGGVYYLRMNLAENRAFSNKNLRHAVYLALDRNELAKKVLSDGSTASGTYVARKLATDPTTGRDFATEMTPSETFNMKKAKELWNKGMKELGKSSVTLDLVTDDQTVSKNVGQFVQSKVETNFKGAKVNVESVPSKSSSGKVSNGDFDMNLTLWLADFANPVSDFDVLSSSNPQNYGKYNSPAYDSQLARARRNGNDEKAFWQNMRNAQQLLNDDMPVVPLYTMTESHLVNPKLSGVLYHSVGETDYTRAYFK